MNIIKRLNEINIELNKLTFISNDLINLEIDEVQAKIEEAIINIKDINNNKNKYILDKKKHNAIMKLFIPYIIAADMTLINTECNFNEKGEFDKLFIKKVLEKYIE